MQKVAIHTLGCKLNFSESSTIVRQLEDNGFERVEFTDIADIYVINTCSVTDNADKKCRTTVKQVLKQNSKSLIKSKVRSLSSDECIKPEDPILEKYISFEIKITCTELEKDIE